MAGPLIPIIARLAMGLARSGAVRGALGAAGRAGGRRAAPRLAQRLARGRQRKPRGVSRRALAAVGRRKAARDLVRRFVPRTQRGGAFSGRVASGAETIGVNLVIPPTADRSRPQAGEPGGPQGPTLPPAAGTPGGPQGPVLPPAPPPPPPREEPKGPVENPVLPQAKTLARTFAKLTGVVGASVAAIGGYMLATQRITRALAESRRELAPYSGQIASAFSRLEVQELRSRIRTARETSGSTALLVDSVRRQNQALEQMNRDIATANNLIGTLNATITEFLGHAYTAIRTGSKWGMLFDAIERNTRKDGATGTPTEDLLKVVLNQPNFAGAPPRDPLPPLQ